MTMNVRTVNVILVIVNSLVRVMKICRGCRGRIPSERKKIHEKEGEKLAATVTNNGKIQLGTDGDVSDFFTGTEESKMLSN